MFSLSLCLLVAAVSAINGTWRQAYPPWDEPDTRTLGSPELYIPIMGPLTVHSCMPSRYIAQRVAVSHLNRRDATFCPAIAELQNTFQVKYDVRDSHASGSGAVLAAMQLMEPDTNSGKRVGTADAKVKVILGPNSSPEVAGAYPFIGGAFSIPYLSWAATMGELGNKDLYEYFFRVVAPDSATLAIQAGFVNWLGYKQVNVMYVNDNAVTTGQAEDFSAAASVRFGMQVQQFAIAASGESSGVEMNEKARRMTRAHLEAIERTKMRIIGCYAFGFEARAIYSIAASMNMAQGPGWLWFGGDGFMSTLFTGDSALDATTRLLTSGTIFVVADTSSPYWQPFQDAWRARMRDIETPEFTEQSICYGGVVCHDRSDFFGLDRNGTRCLNVWLQEAYVSMVTMAVTADRIMSTTGKLPSNFTNADWFAGLRTLITNPFSCLSGKVQLSARQERAADVSFFQYQAGVDVPVKIASWTASMGYGWVPNVTLLWADGTTQVPVERNSTVVLPTGRPPSCPPEQVYFQQELRCRACDEGYSALTVDDVPVCTCSAGYGLDETQACVRCPQGYAKAGPGGQPCTACAEGKVTSTPGSKSCNSCELGKFAPDVGRSACEECGLGYTTLFLGASNRSDCLCAQDFYEEGGQCNLCVSGASTYGVGKRGVENCLCPTGSYKPKSDPKACLPCKDGMLCESFIENAAFGSIERGALSPAGYSLEPRLKEFYWAGNDDTLLVFRCATRERCPGGLPGQACASSLSGRACNYCESGERWSGLECETCEWVDTSYLIFPILPLALGPIIVIVLYRLFGDTYEKWNSPQNGCSAVLFVVLNHYQMIYILVSADVPISSGAHGFMSSFRVSHDVSTPFTLECRGFQSLFSSLLLKALGPAVVALIFAATWSASQVCAKLARKPKRAMEINRTLNGFFSLMLAFFTAIVEQAMMLFKCSTNTAENDLLTLLGDRSVICFGDEWNGLLGIGIAAVLLWVCGFGALFVRTVVAAPKWFHDDKGAQMRWKFLFIKHRADVHWWSLTFIAKGLLLNLAFVVFDTGVAQVTTVSLILLTYSFGVITCIPWRHTNINYGDIWLHSCIIQMCLPLMWFTRGRSDPGDEEVVTRILIAFGLLGLPVSAGIGLSLFWDKLSKSRRERKAEEIRQVRVAYFEAARHPEDQFSKFMLALSDWDFYLCSAAMKVLATDFFGLRVRRGLTVTQPKEALQLLLASGTFQRSTTKNSLSTSSHQSANYLGRASQKVQAEEEEPVIYTL